MKIIMMPTGDLHPNDWNPNRMTDEEFAELVAEVQRSGQLPRPILARPHNGSFQISDGEHDWKAATQLGIAEVPVQVEDMDDLEAMLQTLKRNQHGTHDRVLEGRMFLAMQKAGGLSLKAMEKVVGKSEGYVRGSLGYAKLARLRSGSAPDTADAEVTKLRVSDVREFLAMPPVLAAECMRHDYETPRESEDDDLVTWKYADEIGLLKFVTGCEDLDDALYAIMSHAVVVRGSGEPRLAPLAMVLLKRDASFRLGWILAGDDGPAVTPEALDAAITESKMPRADDEEPQQPRRKKATRRVAVYRRAPRRRAFSPQARLCEIAQRDNWLVLKQRGDWVDPEDQDDQEPKEPTQAELAEQERLRQELKDAPAYVTGMGWPLEEQARLFEIVTEGIALPGVTAEEVEAAAVKAIEDNKEEARDQNYECPSESMGTAVMRLRQRSHFTHREVMIDRIVQWCEDDAVADVGAADAVVRAADFRQRLENADHALLVIIAGGVSPWGEDVWMPYVRESLGGEPPNESDAKKARLRELEAKIGGATA